MVGDDILIGGTTDYHRVFVDRTVAFGAAAYNAWLLALGPVMGVWVGTVDYWTRRAMLSADTAYKRPVGNKGTVRDDGQADVNALDGRTGSDWAFACVPTGQNQTA